MLHPPTPHTHSIHNNGHHGTTREQQPPASAAEAATATTTTTVGPSVISAPLPLSVPPPPPPPASPRACVRVRVVLHPGGGGGQAEGRALPLRLAVRDEPRALQHGRRRQNGASSVHQCDHRADQLMSTCVACCGDGRRCGLSIYPPPINIQSSPTPPHTPQTHPPNPSPNLKTPKQNKTRRGTRVGQSF